MFTKLNLNLKDAVIIHSIGGGVLENATGINLGLSIEHIIDHYIILLDKPLETHIAVTIPESCLKKI